jgi:predicted ATPase
MNTFPVDLAPALHQRTEGNPLFIETVVDHLEATGRIARSDEARWTLATTVEAVQLEEPATIQDIIDVHLDRLSPHEEHVLKAASIAGAQFSTAALAAGLELNEEVVEEHCARLAQRKQFLRARGTEEWPDGTLTARYEFIHTLYQQGWCDRVTAGKRVQLHQRIGERKEQGYTSRAAEIASELAVHFECGRDIRRAIHYHLQAAMNAARRCNYQAAAHHLTKSVILLSHAPESVERAQQESAFRQALSVARLATQGCACPAVEHACAHAQLLYQRAQAALPSLPSSEDCGPFT